MTAQELFDYWLELWDYWFDGLISGWEYFDLLYEV